MFTRFDKFDEPIFDGGRRGGGGVLTGFSGIFQFHIPILVHHVFPTKPNLLNIKTFNFKYLKSYSGLDYYHQKVNVWLASQLAEQLKMVLYKIRKFQENP